MLKLRVNSYYDQLQHNQAYFHLRYICSLKFQYLYHNRVNQAAKFNSNYSIESNVKSADLRYHDDYMSQQ